jgi:hypothetical protein
MSRAGVCALLITDLLEMFFCGILPHSVRFKIQSRFASSRKCAEANAANQ